jgi:hypothetical protein
MRNPKNAAAVFVAEFHSPMAKSKSQKADWILVFVGLLLMALVMLWRIVAK